MPSATPARRGLLGAGAGQLGQTDGDGGLIEVSVACLSANGTRPSTRIMTETLDGLLKGASQVWAVDTS